MTDTFDADAMQAFNKNLVEEFRANGGTVGGQFAGADSIREVIAFPKSGGGYDPLTGAPAPITPGQRAEAGVDAPAAIDQPGEPPSPSRG